MQSNSGSGPVVGGGAGATAVADRPDAVGEAPTVGDVVDALNDIAAVGRRMHDDIVRLIDAVGVAKRSSATVAHIEGLPLDLHVTLTLRMPGGDVAMLEQAAAVLPTMPITDGLFRSGRISWGMLRGILLRVRRLRVAERQLLDERIGASLDFVDALAPEQLWDACDAVVDEIRGARKVERDEARQAATEFVYGQLKLDGSTSVYAEFGPTSSAAFWNALDARADTPEANSEEPGEATTRSQQHAKALIDMCRDDLGRDDEGRPAEPAFVVKVDTDNVTTTEGGTVEIDLPGAIPPRLSAALVDSLLSSGTVKAVLFDGALRAHPRVFGSNREPASPWRARHPEVAFDPAMRPPQ